MIYKDISILYASEHPPGCCHAIEDSPQDILMGYGLNLHDVEDDGIFGVIRIRKAGGIPANDYTAQRILRIDYPALFDVDDVDVRIKGLGETISEVEISKAFQAKLDTKILNTEKRKKADLERYRRSKGYIFGTIFAASGCREKQSLRMSEDNVTVMDWALVRPSPSRVRAFNYDVKATARIAKPGLGPLKDADLLFRFGRRTKETNGKYSGLKAAKLEYNATRGPGITWEHTVVSMGSFQFIYTV
ncbi:hypothetical protein BDV29DRAFT_156705 [Aspergillus leporis]|uniref:Uncharacterized protein n=1 Tax=Aspergillus leporis TaxID=41062 RepID=A0A5N5X0P3_9EURO|nr:hypothetical protein BDV29DRAFT_156705 [Aspergillus leporis]